MKKTKKEPQKRVSSNFSVGAAAPTEWDDFQTGVPVYSTRGRVPSAQNTKSEQLLKDIRRKTKRVFSAEQKIIIVMEGIRGETSRYPQTPTVLKCAKKKCNFEISATFAEI